MIPLLGNRKVCRIYQLPISCFLIDMKYISKIFEILSNHFVSFSDPHLHNFEQKMRYSKSQKNKAWCTWLRKMKNRIMFPYLQKEYFQGCSRNFLVFWSILVINTGSEGPDLVTFLVVPKNPKSIAIDQESLISHLVIMTPPPKKKRRKKTKKIKIIITS